MVIFKENGADFSISKFNKSKKIKETKRPIIRKSTEEAKKIIKKNNLYFSSKPNPILTFSSRRSEHDSKH
jgi:hypothetical protein